MATIQISSMLVALLSVLSVQCQDFSILHYTETSGWDHNTRTVSLNMFNELGDQYNFMVEDDQTGEAFNSLENLQNYAVVVFSNTSGDEILNADQRANFEAYMESGGAYIGIHAASDTYRHSTANGSNTGAWDWYAEMLGASVQNNPNHTSANYNGVLNHVGAHVTTANIPDPWNKTEEYYYWENGFYGNANQPVLQVESTGSESYDAARPMSWYRILPEGGRVFYTALGHSGSNYTDDSNFRNHIRDAVLWAAQVEVMGVEDYVVDFDVYPNPAIDNLNIHSHFSSAIVFRIVDMTGREVFSEMRILPGKNVIEIADLSPGLYLLQVPGEVDVEAVPLIVK